MNKVNYSILSAACCLALSASAYGAMSKAANDVAKDQISAQYKADTLACKNVTGNANDICIAEAKGRENVAKEELEQSYSPSTKHRYDVRIAKAEAAYAVAKEKCDDLADNAKDVCRKEANSVYVSAKADANVAEKTTKARTAQNEKTHDARVTAKEKTAEARSDASAEKRKAAYAVAKEKCDALTDAAKDNCVKEAKTLYGQS